MTTHTAPRATFSHMEHGTREDWAAISAEFMPFARALPDRVLAHLQLLDGDCGGFPIDRLAHSLQTATLAHRDGRDEEYVVCALLHDVGDTLGSFNHPDRSVLGELGIQQSPVPPGFVAQLLFPFRAQLRPPR